MNARIDIDFDKGTISCDAGIGGMDIDKIDQQRATLAVSIMMDYLYKIIVLPIDELVTLSSLVDNSDKVP